MKLFHTYYLLIFLSLRVAASKELGRHAKQGCDETCGNNVTIPYPFGIGAECAVNEWYVVECSSLKPYLQALNYRFEIVGVSLRNQTISVIDNFMPPYVLIGDNPLFDCVDIDPLKGLTPKSIQRYNIDFHRSPFWLSAPGNIFMFEGCGNAVMMDHGSTVLTNCSTTCLHDTTPYRRRNNNCLFGIDCCQTSIPRYVNSYNISSRLDLEKQGRDKACGSAFVMDKSSYINRSYLDIRHHDWANSYVPISLLWTLSENDYNGVTCSCGFGRAKLKVHLGNGTSINTWKCRSFSSFNGNPYLKGGCQETTDIQYTTDVCSKYCRDNGSHCDDSDTIYNINGSVYQDVHYCYKPKKSLFGVVLGVSLSLGVSFLMAISYALYIKEKRRRNRFFKRNGGILLKQQAEADPSLVDKIILFTSRELAKATDDFNENRVLGRGGQGTVYKGMLVDGRIVAIKKSKVVDESQLEQFINEMVILSQINHRNVVKLLGCCLETEVPLLVSEFISNGTLYDRLHNDTDDFPLSLNMRLQIATEVAGALAYLHSAALIPIYHRDIKTTNILLDDKYRAKVSDFGTSRLVSLDQSHLTTMVKGTFGYLDPEYFQSSQFTEKSDVYSFGVVLVELITGEKPVSHTRFGEHRNLATHFTIAMEEGRVVSTFDEKMIKEATGDELLLIANLAMRCLNLIGKNRPTMKEVAGELETIRTPHIPSTDQTNINPMIYGEELSTQPYGESTSTFSLDDSKQPYGESTSTSTFSLDDSISHIGR